MKRMIYLLIATLFLGSCSSIQKHIDRGEYDEAFFLALNKVSKRKNKKTQDIQNLELAFEKIIEREMRNIQDLKAEDRDENWDIVYRRLDKIKSMQNRMYPFLPLVSKDGYQANFKFVKTNDLMKEAADHASDYHYKSALIEIAYAEKGDKDAARNAHRLLSKIDLYYSRYEDKEELKRRAMYLGKTRILVDLVNHAPVIIPADFEDEIMGIGVRDMNTKWTEYYVADAHGAPIDIVARIEILDLDISPEREIINHFEEEKKIENGTKPMKDRHGKIMKDSLGNVLTQIKYKKVRAHVDQIERFKAAYVTGRVVYEDQWTGETLRSRPIKSEKVFRSFACSFNGDKRALSDETRRKLRGHPMPFPSDYAISLDAAICFKDLMKEDIKDSVF